MADIKSPEERSLNMSKIKSKNTKPEEYIRKRLYEKGYRYRKNYSSVFGHPDIWIPKHKVAVFVNGCYWHRHKGCKYATMPKSNVDFWEKKLYGNRERDERNQKELESMGWNVITVWECQLNKDKREQTLEELYSKITSEI